MAIFKKNPNEVAFAGGKKHWADVIKNIGPGGALLWKQPEEDFNTNSTLIVMPGEQALFIKGGTVEQTFENGTYKLSTENYPFISRLRNAFTGGISTFNCVVYFVRYADSEEIRWGTETPIQVRDKVFNIRTEARARGSYKVRIVNPSLFLEKLVGSNVNVQAPGDLEKYFASEFQGKIKSAVSKYLNSLETDLIGIDTYLEDISEAIEPKINEVVADYGLKCVRFSLAGLDIDTSKYDVIDASQLELIRKTKEYQGEKVGLDILGPDWTRVKGVDVLKDLAQNPGAGGVAATGAGLGMGIGAAGAFGSIAQQVFAPMTKDFSQSPQPVQTAPSGRFVQNGAFPSAPTATPTSTVSVDDPMEVLGKLKKLLDAGLIEKSEYDAKKAEILSRM